MNKLRLLVVALLFTLSSCDQLPINEPEVPQEVGFTLDYDFFESDPLTKNGANAYDDFYENHIKTKELTPKNYTLTFTNEEGEVAAIVSGNWAEQDMIKLTEGKYTVTGYSGSMYDQKFAPLLAFNNEVTVTKSTTEIKLTATYDCLLVMFDSARISNADYVTSTGSYGRTDLYSVDNVLYMFLSDEFEANYVIEYQRTGSYDLSKVYLNNLGLEKGNYYYFNDITGSFNVPPMTEGK